MKEIEKQIEYLRFAIREQCNCKSCEDDRANIGDNCVIRQALVSHHNTLLETQALALEGMKYPYCRAQWASSDIEGAECDGKNSALQQAADHLRSQKINK